MEQMLPSDLDATFTSDWEGPLDGREIDQGSVKDFRLFSDWRITSTNQYWNRRLKKGEIGGSISHWRCWKDAAERNADRAVFFEDDIRLVEPFTERLYHAIQTLETRYREWDLLYLGRFRKKPNMPPPLAKDRRVNDELVRPGFSYGAHAYVLNRSGIQKILAVGFENDLIPIDELLPALYIIHPRPDVARRYRPILNAFALEPAIAVHLPLEEVGSDAEDTDFVDW